MNAMTDVTSPISAPETKPVATYDARDLIPTESQASIILDGKVYYLRITRAGKLILTK